MAEKDLVKIINDLKKISDLLINSKFLKNFERRNQIDQYKILEREIPKLQMRVEIAELDCDSDNSLANKIRFEKAKEAEKEAKDTFEQLGVILRKI